jgi:hypothetical protein
MLARPSAIGQNWPVVPSNTHIPYTYMTMTKRGRRRSSRRCEATDELKYWNNVWRRARRFEIDLPDKKWCDYWHTHFDWESRGTRSRSEHRKHIRPMMLAFARAKSELKGHAQSSQVFACIYPSDPGSDALYIHTPNPNSAFPASFDNCKFTNTCPPLLMGLVDMKQYLIGISRDGSSVSYKIVAR